MHTQASPIIKLLYGGSYGLQQSRTPANDYKGPGQASIHWPKCKLLGIIEGFLAWKCSLPAYED